MARCKPVIELNAVTDLDAVVQGVPALQNGSRANFWLRMLREACLAPSLINGGAGCATQSLRELDFRLRGRGMGSIWQAGNPADGLAAYDPSTIRSLTPGDALKWLMQGRDVSETARHHKGNHMVRHGNKEQGVYDRNRSYAMPTIQERLVDVEDQRKALYDRVNIARRDVPLLRWRWALECITSGRYWDDTAPRSRFSILFLRRAFEAIRLNQSFAVADERLQYKQTSAFFDGVEFHDRAKLKQALSNAIPTGTRVIRVRALTAYDPPTAEELAFKKDDVITVVATTRAGWRALGFSHKEANIAPPSYLSRERDDGDYVLLGCISSAVQDPPVGLKWEEIKAEEGQDAAAKPKNRIEIKNPRLAEALQTKLEFTRAEFELFGLWELSLSCYIQTGEAGSDMKYFKPVDPCGPNAELEVRRFKVQGSIGIVHSKMVKIMGPYRAHAVELPSGRVANLREEQANPPNQSPYILIRNCCSDCYSRFACALLPLFLDTLSFGARLKLFTYLYTPQVKTLREIESQARESLEKIKDIDPYLGILRRASAAGAGQVAVCAAPASCWHCLPACKPFRLTPCHVLQSREDSIQQSGFQQLYAIELGQAPMCSVCQEGCGYDQRPTYMRCAHFACEVKLIQFSPPLVFGVPPADSYESLPHVGTGVLFGCVSSMRRCVWTLRVRGLFISSRSILKSGMRARTPRTASFAG